MNQDQKDRLYSALMQSMIRYFKYIPLEVTGHIFDFAGRCAYYLLPKKRRDGYWSMRLALAGQLSETQRRQELRAQFRHLARNLGEVLTFEQLTKEEILRTIDVEGWERFEAVMKSGKGVVLITAHYGNWELMQIYSGLRGRPIHVLGRDQKFPRLNSILIQQRQVHGSVAVSRGMNMRFLMKALKDGDLTGMLGDESAGRAGGILLPFFGKITTVPTGAFDLACRTDAVVLPCFMIRSDKRRHFLYIDDALPVHGCNDAEVIESQAKLYLARLEYYIRRSPRQWLWQNKRWKYSWTRDVVILSDKKPGHFKQTRAVAALFSTLKEYHHRPGLEFRTQTIDVEYHSAFHAKLFFALGWLMLPMIRGRMGWLKAFIKPESVKMLMQTHADFIFAAGSSLAPLQHCYAAETGAKKIVLMKPPLPYALFNYDLAVVPAHDEGFIPKNNFRTFISPSGYADGCSEEEKRLLAAEILGKGDLAAAVFVGGKTRDFDWTVSDAEKLLTILERSTAKIGGYVLTTSRRTALGVERFFKHQIQNSPACRKLIIANEDSRSFVVKGMLGLAKKIVVTEDSLAMISEAVASGKPVWVLRTQSQALPEKHRRFLEELTAQGWVRAVSWSELEKGLAEDVVPPSMRPWDEEKARLLKKLEGML